MNITLKVASLAMAAIAATSCGSSKLTTQNTHTAGGVVSNSSSLALRYTGVFTMTFEGGYSASVKLQRGNLIHAKAHDAVDGLVVGDTCGIDDQTDAVEPFQFTITNTTKGFSSDFSFTLSLRELYDADPLVMPINVQAEIEQEGQAQAQCVNWQDTNNVPSLNTPTLSPGASTTITGDFIVSEVFTPNDPTGVHYTAMKSVFIDFEPARVKSGMIDGQTTNIDGQYGPFDNQAVLPFDPAYDTACINNGGTHCAVPPGLGWPPNNS